MWHKIKFTETTAFQGNVEMFLHDGMKVKYLEKVIKKVSTKYFSNIRLYKCSTVELKWK